MNTMKKINKALAKEFHNNLELVKAKDYFYFSGKEADNMKQQGIYGASLQSLSPESVVQIAKDRKL